MPNNILIYFRQLFPKSNWRRITLLALIFLFILWAMLYQAGTIGGPHKTAPGERPEADSPEISGWVTAEKKIIPIFYSAVGTVYSRDEVDIISRLPAARILTIKVKSGDQVERDSVLAELDDRDLQAAVDTAEENLKMAESRLDFIQANFNRVNELMAKNVVPQQAFDEAKSNLNASLAETAMMRHNLEIAKINLSYATILSPFKGIISERLSDPGNLATMESPLMKMFDPEKLELRIPIREGLISKVKVGDVIEAKIESLGKMVKAEIIEIIPSVDPGSRTFQINASVASDRKGVMPGMFARAQIQVGQKEAIIVPESALKRIGQLEYILIKNADGRPREIMVSTVASEQDGFRVILSGLQAGDQYYSRATE